MSTYHPIKKLCLWFGGEADERVVNELSNTIDLDSTLVRAEQLFRKYQRTVEAVDRKNHFPVPSNVRQRKPAQIAEAPVAESSAREGGRPGAAVQASGPDKGKGKSVGAAVAEGIGAEKKKEISPELRDLLKTEVYYKLDKTEVKEHGGGVGS